MKLIKPFIITGLFFLITVLTPATVPAIPMAEILYVESELDDGIWQYDYTVFNKLDLNLYENFDIYYVFFEFTSAEAEVEVTSVPYGWDYFSSGNFVETESLHPGIPPDGTDIAPWDSLGGFTFVFNQKVGKSAFEVLFWISDEEDPLHYTGITVPVPEPATILLLAVGMGGLGLVRRRKLTDGSAKRGI